jgi:hypothetical protein
MSDDGKTPIIFAKMLRVGPQVYNPKRNPKVDDSYDEFHHDGSYVSSSTSNSQPKVV